MKQLKAGDKIVQQMTREGAAELNKATGEAANISTRAVDGVRASPGASDNAPAENIQSSGNDSMYVLGGVVDRVQAERAASKKRRAKKSNAEIYNRANKDPENARLKFSEADRADPGMKKPIRKSEKAANRYEKAQGKIPKALPTQRVSEPGGKTETRLSFREGDKPANGRLQHALERPGREAALFMHREVGKSDNTGVQAAHATEKAAEGAARKLGAGYRHLKFRHHRAAHKAEKKLVKANSKALYHKSIRQRPELKKAGLFKKAIHKRRIKKEYAKAFRAGQAGVKGTVAVVKKVALVKAAIVKAALVIKLAAIKAAKLAAALKVIIPIAAALFLLILLMAGVSSCMAMFGGGMSSIIATTYTAEDEDIWGAHADYTALENALNNRIENIPNEFPGYDEYRFFLDPIGHDPHELISFLTALYFAFTQEEVQATLQSLFNQQYILTLTPIVEVRTREEERTGTGTGTDPDGYPYTYTYTYTVIVEYNWYVLVVTLNNRGIREVAAEILNADQYEMFLMLLEAQGNRPDLFGGEPLSIAELMERANIELPRIFRPQPTQTPPPQERPTRVINPNLPPAMTDSQFTAMREEAKQFIGYPYVWGGSNPATGFDCSGFVSWVINQSGVGSVGRTNVRGLYARATTIPRYEAQPGDLIFFINTFANAIPNAPSHVGIYLGNNEMIHAGSPVNIADITRPFWVNHFYAIGRLP